MKNKCEFDETNVSLVENWLQLLRIKVVEYNCTYITKFSLSLNYLQSSILATCSFTILLGCIKFHLHVYCIFYT